MLAESVYKQWIEVLWYILYTKCNTTAHCFVQTTCGIEKRHAAVFPRKMPAKGSVDTYKEKLPIEPGRIWYEADIHYYGGRRGTDRVLYSNDGLIFVTYDHYTTFCEIV